MPKEIFDPDEFLALSEKAQECRVKRLGEVTKLKLKTSRYLYTIKLDPGDAEGLLGRMKCQKIEV